MARDVESIEQVTEFYLEIYLGSTSGYVPRGVYEMVRRRGGGAELTKLDFSLNKKVKKWWCLIFP